MTAGFCVRSRETVRQRLQKERLPVMWCGAPFSVSITPRKPPPADGSRPLAARQFLLRFCRRAAHQLTGPGARAARAFPGVVVQLYARCRPSTSCAAGHNPVDRHPACPRAAAALSRPAPGNPPPCLPPASLTAGPPCDPWDAPAGPQSSRPRRYGAICSQKESCLDSPPSIRLPHRLGDSQRLPLRLAIYLHLRSNTSPSTSSATTRPLQCNSRSPPPTTSRHRLSTPIGISGSCRA